MFRSVWTRLELACGVLATGLVLALGPTGAALATADPAAETAPTPSPVLRPGVPLDRKDLEAWLDGYVPSALDRGDVAGAVVVVVKDGEVLLQKGYGHADLATGRPVDPATTMFRAASVSKLFTWTAVMQLVESGRINLDADINRYLDFVIPPRAGRAVTMRDLMTHTAGFEEAYKGLMVRDREDLPGLEAYVKAWTPRRIYPAGETVAYSNYGATLAGYIVQRVSGEPFEVYVQKHVLTPLGMEHSTFAQAPDSQPDLATGYLSASAGARAFEFAADVPAGALSASGADMGRFMLAYLNGGAGQNGHVLRPETIRQMHTLAYRPAPQLNGMALGFYGEDRNGRRILGHAGDLITFHADLHLLVDDHVGVYIAMNSWGRDNASTHIREGLFAGFLDRYYPGEAEAQPTLATAPGDGRRLVGSYQSSRRSEGSFAGLAAWLGQGVVRQRPDGTLTFSPSRTAQGQARVFHQIEPRLWREVGGDTLLSAVTRDGRVVQIATSDGPPVLVWGPAPWWRDAAWTLPVMGGVVLLLGVACLVFATAPLVRRAYGRGVSLTGVQARNARLAKMAVLAHLVFLSGWLGVVLVSSADLTVLGPGLDPWLRLLQVLGLAAAGLTAFTVLDTVRVWRDRPRRWRAGLASGVLVFACLATTGFALTFHLFAFSLQY